ncbi:MAG: ribose-phosphate pyrophosphokinase [Lachnospiraceae bacterium]|nr:ribose-phosphate pyrophosphokinase [Lachnospiraceae bacterium]
MEQTYSYHSKVPIAPLKICAMENCIGFAKEVDAQIRDMRQEDGDAVMARKAQGSFYGYDADTYMVRNHMSRFGTGEGKATLLDSVRGTDLYIITDVINHSLSYTVCGHTHYMSPDDHYQDLKRIISVCVAHAHRVNVVMPFLYEGRQHRRTKRESLDCAFALEELIDMGVKNIITFDAHDPRITNAVPLHGLDNYMPTYQFFKAIFDRDSGLNIDKEHLMIISPDEGAMDRAVYFANNLGVDMGMFYKRRDYSQVIGGKNPIVAHEFLGASVENKTVIIIDDMISSGDSMLDTSRELKERGASKVIICCTFGLFTSGLEKFDEFHKKGFIDYVVTTNLNYRDPALLTKPWYIEADMSSFTALIINTMNHDTGMSAALDPTMKIQKLIAEYNSRIKEFTQLKLDLE